MHPFSLSHSSLSRPKETVLVAWAPFACCIPLTLRGDRIIMRQRTNEGRRACSNVAGETDAAMEF